MKIQRAWNKDLKENPEVTVRRSVAMKKWWSNSENRKLQSNSHKHMQGDKHNSWKGDDVGYYGLHQWLRKTLGNAQKCMHCRLTDQKRYEWANISGDYKRDISDWLELCKKCHISYDRSSGRWGHTTKKFNLTRGLEYAHMG